ncbi:MAG: hypothetical protein FJY97_00230 [candidate division Zixibacteria bacterium]|nr:hypothetical protein [candidate division Zixibacteria bacterium]
MKRRFVAILGLALLMMWAACRVDLISSSEGTSVSISYRLSGGIAGSLHEVSVDEQGQVKITLRGIPTDADIVKTLTPQQRRELEQAVLLATAQIKGDYEPAEPVADDFALELTLRDTKSGAIR